jgi:hypothetical protein
VPEATNCMKPKDSLKTLLVVPSSKVSEPAHTNVKLFFVKFPALSLKVITFPGMLEAEGSVIDPELFVVFISAKSVFKFKLIYI